MTDKELLELAAKVAGISGVYAVNSYQKTHGIRQADDSLWNPLTDDGDALRLAVKLNIDISKAIADSYFENIELCAIAFTRRAIVRAAAEIGKNL